MNVKIPKDKYFYIKTPEEMLEVMKKPVIAALNLTLDKLFEAINSEGYDYNEVKDNEPAVIAQYRNSIGTYQTLLDKIKAEEELSTFDYDLIVLVCKNTSIMFETQAKSLKEGATEMSKIAWKIAHLNLNSAHTTEVLQKTKNLTEIKN